ncbi:hypothetical protein Hanom_Chr09g00817511 [Helianthus anomalus]
MLNTSGHFGFIRNVMHASTLYTNCHVDSSKMLYTYAILFKPCVLAFAFALTLF